MFTCLGDISYIDDCEISLDGSQNCLFIGVSGTWLAKFNKNFYNRSIRSMCMSYLLTYIWSCILLTPVWKGNKHNFHVLKTVCCHFSDVQKVCVL